MERGELLKPLNPPSKQSMQKGQKKGRANSLLNKQFPVIMGNIFDDLMPSLATEKKAPLDASGRNFSILKKRGARR